MTPEVLHAYTEGRLWVRWGNGPYQVLAPEGIERVQFSAHSSTVELIDPDGIEHECCDCPRECDCEDDTEREEMIDDARKLLLELISENDVVELHRGIREARCLLRGWGSG